MEGVSSGRALGNEQRHQTITIGDGVEQLMLADKDHASFFENPAAGEILRRTGCKHLGDDAEHRSNCVTGRLGGIGQPQTMREKP